MDADCYEMELVWYILKAYFILYHLNQLNIIQLNLNNKL